MEQKSWWSYPHLLSLISSFLFSLELSAVNLWLLPFHQWLILCPHLVRLTSGAEQSWSFSSPWNTFFTLFLKQSSVWLLHHSCSFSGSFAGCSSSLYPWRCGIPQSESLYLYSVSVWAHGFQYMYKLKAFNLLSLLTSLRHWWCNLYT